MAKQESHTEGSSVASDLIHFLDASPTAFHDVDEAKRRLRNAGYVQISERDDWNLEIGKRYFFTRNHSTIVAFAIGKKLRKVGIWRLELPIMRVPTLAIHLDKFYCQITLSLARNVNSDGYKVNKQNHLLPIPETMVKTELNKGVAES